MSSIYYVNGWDGNDEIYGGKGNDILHVSKGIDYLDGGEGNDTLEANYKSLSYKGVHFGANVQSNGYITIEDKESFNKAFFTSIEVFKVTGTDYDDTFDLQVIDSGGEGSIFKAGKGNDEFYSDKRIGTILNGTLQGQAGDDTFYATEGYLDGGKDSDTLVADYSELSYDGKGIEFGFRSDFNYEEGVRVAGSQSVTNPLLTFQEIESYEIIGTQHDDTFHTPASSTYSDFYKGEAGNDTFIGEIGKFYGGAGNDILIADYSNIHNPNPDIESLHINPDGLGSINGNSDANTLGRFQGIETLHITASVGNDTVKGGNGNDILDGSAGDDTLKGGAGDDELYGGSGNDELYGGDGNDQLFARSNADQLYGGSGNDYLYAVSHVSEQAVHKDVQGGDGADTFVLDQEGSIGLAFDFNANVLGSFVSNITYPDTKGSTWEDYATDIGFGMLGAVAGSVPYVGSVLGFAVEMVELGVNGLQEQQEIQEKINTHIGRVNRAVDHYSNANWGSVNVRGQRDTITIHDFTPGLDTIVLPELDIVPGQSNPSYEIKQTFRGNQSGVTVSINNQPSNNSDDIEFSKDVVFIANSTGMQSNEFQGLVQDLLIGSVIGTFNQAVITGTNQEKEENIRGTMANDTILSSGGDDEVFGYYGHDFIYGQDGDDILYGGTNSDQNLEYLEETYGHDGNDFLIGGNGNDELYGETGDDNLWGGNGNDELYGGDGNDVLKGDAHIQAPSVGGDENSNREVTHGEGNDKLYGGAGNDTLQGGAGDDELFGKIGNDTLEGGAGNDILNPGYNQGSSNKVEGGTGNDLLKVDYSSKSNDTGIHLGLNNNDAIYHRNNHGDNYRLVEFSSVERFEVTGTTYDDIFEGHGGDDIFRGKAGNDILQGGDGNDLLRGGTGDDKLFGGTGNDTLYGEAGNDILTGGKGNDILTGGKGNDILTGGEGVDRFAFMSPADGVDTITNFQVGLDKIQLNASEFGGFWSQYFGGISYEPATGVLSFDADLSFPWFFNPFSSNSHSFEPETIAILENAPENFNVSTDIVMV